MIQSAEAEIAGYRYVLGQLHASGPDIPFEPRYVEQMHGYLYRFTGDRDAGRFKRLDNTVEERHPDGTVVPRFTPVSADQTPQAMSDLHRGFHAAQGHYPELLLAAAYGLDFLVMHEGEHDLMPWAGYFLGVLVAVYDEFESRTDVATSRGSKRALVESFVRSSMSSRFTVADVREAAPGVSDIYIRRVLDDLKKDGVIEPSGRGAAAFWTSLRDDF